MKYFIFLFLFIAGVPVIAVMSSRNAFLRSLCWAGLVGFIALGDLSGVNFLSTETYRGTDRGFELTFTDMFALGLLLSKAFGAPRLKLFKPRKSPGFLLFIIYLLYSLIGISGSIMPLYGFFTIWKMLRVLLIFGVCWSAGISEADPNVFFTGLRRGLVFGLLAVGLMGMKQKFVEGVYRVKGTFDHSNTIPLYVNLAAAPILAWILGDAKLKRLEFLISFAAVGSSLVAILATQSRLGIVLAGMSVGGALIWSNFGPATRRARAAAIVFVMAATVGGLMVMDTLIDRFLNAPESSAEAREEFNIAAEEMAKDELFGVGLNNFPITMTRIEKYRAQVEVMANEEESGVAHHLYLLTAAETGYPGLLFLIAVFASIMLWYLRFLLKKRTKEEKLALGFLPQVVWGALFGQVALFTSCFFEWAFRITPVISQYFIVSGAICAAIYRAGKVGDEGFGLAFARSKGVLK